MANTIIGKVLSTGQTVNVSKNKEFLKRELVLDCSRYDEYTGEKKENYVSVSFTQKRCEDLNGIRPGERVEVSFLLSGRKYEKDGQTRYITDIIGYKVERKDEVQNISAPQPVAPQPTAAPAPAAPQAQQFPPQADAQGNQSELPF